MNSFRAEVESGLLKALFTHQENYFLIYIYIYTPFDTAYLSIANLKPVSLKLNEYWNFNIIKKSDKDKTRDFSFQFFLHGVHRIDLKLSFSETYVVTFFYSNT